jgi:hypothetical protein
MDNTLFDLDATQESKYETGKRTKNSTCRVAVRNKISNTEMYKNEKTLMLKKAQQMFFLT